MSRQPQPITALDEPPPTQIVLPAYTSSTFNTYSNEQIYSTAPPARPPSPAPSYHTIAPKTHTTLPPSTIPESTALQRAALETPDLTLSKLIITNASKSDAKRPAGLPRLSDNVTERYVSATTDPDGKERYHITFPSVQNIKVFKGNEVGGQSLIASMTIYASGIKVVYAGSGAGASERVEATFKEIQEGQRMKVGLSVGGVEKRFYWEVVSEDAERRGSQEHDRGRGVLGIESRRKKETMRRILGMRLVDEEEGKVWAEYVHDHGLGKEKEKDESLKSSTSRSGKWGYVEIKCRAILLDDGVDRAFVSLMGLLEAYVRLFGPEYPDADKWGVLVGVLFCTVM